MSLDTVERVNAYLKTAIADTFNYYTNYDNENKNRPESNTGPQIRLFVEIGLDEQFNDGVEYIEDGTIIAQIFVEHGKSATQLHTIATQIRNAFRGPKGGLQIEPTGGQEGLLVFESIENIARGEISRKPVGRAKNQSTRMWKRLDVMITYTKYYS